MAATIELPRTRPAGPGEDVGGDWHVIVCNDDHNTFDHVAETLAYTIPGVTLAQGYALADRVHRNGLAIVWIGEHELAQNYWGELAGAGLTMAPLERA
jgi:ATP-dependent Clp protease adaptor protein ClpS